MAQSDPKSIEISHKSISDYPDRETPVEAIIEITRDTSTSLVPGLGPILDRLITSPLHRRQTHWLNEVAHTLNELKTDLDHRTGQTTPDEQFLDLFLQASQIALRSHQGDKHRFLLAALRNAALHPNDFDRQQFFLSLLDEFQPLQIKILSLFADPSILISTQSTPLHHPTVITEMLDKAYPELADMIPSVVANLEARGLIRSSQQVELSKSNMRVTGGATPLGRLFLEFIGEEAKK